jgi:hypothetical protein
MSSTYEDESAQPHKGYHRRQILKNETSSDRQYQHHIDNYTIE